MKQFSYLMQFKTRITMLHLVCLIVLNSWSQVAYSAINENTVLIPNPNKPTMNNIQYIVGQKDFTVSWNYQMQSISDYGFSHYELKELNSGQRYYIYSYGTKSKTFTNQSDGTYRFRVRVVYRYNGGGKEDDFPLFRRRGGGPSDRFLAPDKLYSSYSVEKKVTVIYIVNDTEPIRTDPANAYNPQRPDLLNNFNWRDRNFAVYHPSDYTNGTGALMITNPYFKREAYQEHFNLYSYSNTLPQNEEPGVLDFHPEDGWELLHKHNGFLPDETTLVNAVDNRNGPYQILYNKYTTQMRLLASFDNIGANEKIVTTLKFKNASGSAPNLKYSALFNNYGNAVIPLDQKTSISEIASASNAAINKGYISADFNMSYDPCTCFNNSELVAEFSTLNTADISLEGRMIATSVPLDDSGDSPLLNRKDFLTSVYKDDFTVNGGMLTYNNINTLVQKYKAPQRSLFEKIALDGISAIIGSATGGLDDVLDGVASIFVSNAVGGASIFGFDIPDTVNVGMGAFAAGANHITSAINPKHSVPNISFIEGEMILSGTMEDEIPLNNGTINLMNPGSKDSELASWLYYPTYNRPLGLIAVTETPKMYYTVDQMDGNCESERFEFFKLDDFKYTLNPYAEIDEEKTKIFAAIEFDTQGSGLDFLYESFGNLEHVPDSLPDDNKETYITPFVPLNQIKSLVPMLHAHSYAIYDWQQDCMQQPRDFDFDKKVYFKLMIQFVFKENIYGKVNQTLKVLRYPVELIESNIAEQNYVSIQGMQLDASGKLPLPIAEINKVSTTYVNNFCFSKYKANLIGASTSRTQIENTVSNLDKETKTKMPSVNEENLAPEKTIIYPNPNNGNFAIRFDYAKQNKCEKVIVLNKENQTLFESKIGSFDKTLEVDISRFPKGYYFVKLIYKDKVVTKTIRKE